MGPSREDVDWLHSQAEASEPVQVPYAELVARGFTTTERQELSALLDTGCKFATREGRLYVTARSFWLACFRISAYQGPPPSVH